MYGEVAMAAAAATASAEASSRSGGGGAGGATADSYIGSLISLTSKCEIRYEGVLYNINTEESSIGLRNGIWVHFDEFGSFETPFFPLFTNSANFGHLELKDERKMVRKFLQDLQVKASPPVQATAPAPIHDDPAIIQAKILSHSSHYPQPSSVSTSLPSAGSGLADPALHTSQLGLPRPAFQGGLPLYQPSGGLGSWGSSHAPNATSPGLPMQMYWQGYYGPSSALPQVQQQSLLRPPPGLPIPQSIQQPMQYPGMSSSLPTGVPHMMEVPSPVLPSFSSTMSLTSSALPSTVITTQPAALASELFGHVFSSTAPVSSLSTTTPNANLPLLSPLTSSSFDINAAVTPISKPQSVPSSALPYQTLAQPISSVVGPSASSHSEASAPSLVTPGQLLQSGPTVLPSLGPSQKGKDVEVVQPKSSELSASAHNDTQEPILPLPTPSDHKLNGAVSQTRQSSRGRERGRGNGILRAATRFTEEFDFDAMNEKFNKDEVWGHLGRSKGPAKDRDGDATDYGADDGLGDDEAGSLKGEMKPVYVKDDFFDSLSCNALDRGSWNGRTRFSEQMKIDTETFGDFPRHRGRGGRGPGWGSRGRGGPYYGRGYGYAGRGRGHYMPNHNCHVTDLDKRWHASTSEIVTSEGDIGSEKLNNGSAHRPIPDHAPDQDDGNSGRHLRSRVGGSLPWRNFSSCGIAPRFSRVNGFQKLELCDFGSKYSADPQRWDGGLQEAHPQKISFIRFLCSN
ncbi:hypothetical protein ACLOJK_001466 [Asimina triloba]